MAEGYREGWRILGIPIKIFLLLTTTLLLVVVSGVNSLSESIQQKSYLPILKDVGTRVLSSETIMQQEVDYLKANPGLIYVNPENNTMQNKFKVYWNRTASYFNLALALWTFLVITYLIYLFWYSRDQTNVFAAIAKALLTVVVIEVAFGLFTLASVPSPHGRDATDVVKTINPFRGIYAIVTNWDFLFGDTLRRIQAPLEQATKIQEDVVAKRLT